MAVKPHQVLSRHGLEAQALIEAPALACHQIGALAVGDAGVAQQGFDQAPPQPLAFLIIGDDDVPEDGAIDPITGRSSEPHQGAVLPPGGDDGTAAPEHAVQAAQAAVPGPEAVLIQQALQLLHGAYRAATRSEAQPQSWGTGTMPDPAQ